MCLRLDVCHGVKLVLFCVQDREGHIAGLSVVRIHRGVFIMLSKMRSLLIRGRPLTVLTVDSGVLLRTAKDPDTV